MALNWRRPFEEHGTASSSCRPALGWLVQSYEVRDALKHGPLCIALAQACRANGQTCRCRLHTTLAECQTKGHNNINISQCKHARINRCNCHACRSSWLEAATQATRWTSFQNFKKVIQSSVIGQVPFLIPSSNWNLKIAIRQGDRERGEGKKKTTVNFMPNSNAYLCSHNKHWGSLHGATPLDAAIANRQTCVQNESSWLVGPWTTGRCYTRKKKVKSTWVSRQPLLQQQGNKHIANLSHSHR